MPSGLPRSQSPFTFTLVIPKRRNAPLHTAFKIDYTRSYTASSFVPYYAQRLSTACVVYGAAGILDALKVVRADRLRAA